MFGPPSVQVARNRARIVGTAPDYHYDPESPMVEVDGLYDVSMIRVLRDSGGSHCEVVAFHLSGIGPRQIIEPIGKPTLDVIEFAKGGTR